MPTLDLIYHEVRHLDDTAIPFVLNSWLKSYRWSDRDNENYYRETVPEIKKLIRGNRVVVAALAEEPDCFVGWLCGQKGILNYVYVKSTFRRDGIARALIDRVCGPYGVYTSKSRNNSFLRALDEKGFEYDGKEARDQKRNSKAQHRGSRGVEPDRECTKSVSEHATGSGPGRRNHDVNRKTGLGVIHTA